MILLLSGGRWSLSLAGSDLVHVIRRYRTQPSLWYSTVQATVHSTGSARSPVAAGPAVMGAAHSLPASAPVILAECSVERSGRVKITEVANFDFREETPVVDKMLVFK